MTKLNEFTQTLRDRLPISVVAAKFVALKKKGREYSGLCPFHQEKGPSFTINDDKGFYHCFGCGAHGDLFNFVMQKMNMPFMDAVEYLADQVNLTVPRFEGQRDNAQAIEINKSFYQTMELACQWFEKQLRQPESEFVRQYLINRAMTGTIAKKFRVGYAPEAGLKEFLKQRGCTEEQLIELGLIILSDRNLRTYDRFRCRVMFPIQDTKGRIIAFGGRVIEHGEPKYLNSPDTPLFHKGRQLYGLNHALSKARQGEQFVVVEGYMDVISLHQHGIETAVAPLGTAMTIEQLQLLWHTCANPVLCFDGDAAGKRAAERMAHKALELLKPGVSLAFCFLNNGEDPDSYIKQEGVNSFQQALSQAQPLNDVLWNYFITRQDLSTPEQKAKARKEVLELTDQIADPDIKHFYRQDFQRRLQGILYVPWNKNSNPYAPVANLVTRKLTEAKKNIDGQRILLATLLNHPTLVSQISEQLMDLTLTDDSLYNLRQKILEFCETTPNINSVDLKQRLQQAGFKAILDQILCRDLYHQAPFAHQTADLELAEEGWLEIWKAMQEWQKLKKEINQTAAELSSSLDEESWKKLKFLKKNLYPA